MVTKPGAGGRQQPYIPAGNGDSSGEYTSFDSSSMDARVKILSSIVGDEEVVKYAYKKHKPPLQESAHLKQRIAERKIPRIYIADALLKPLEKSDVKIDGLGRKSITYYSMNVTVTINPDNGNIITVNKTRRNIRNKLKEKYHVSR